MSSRVTNRVDFRQTNRGEDLKRLGICHVDLTDPETKLTRSYKIDDVNTACAGEQGHVLTRQGGFARGEVHFKITRKAAGFPHVGVSPEVHVVVGEERSTPDVEKFYGSGLNRKDLMERGVVQVIVLPSGEKVAQEFLSAKCDWARRGCTKDRHQRGCVRINLGCGSHMLLMGDVRYVVNRQKYVELCAFAMRDDRPPVTDLPEPPEKEFSLTGAELQSEGWNCLVVSWVEEHNQVPKAERIEMEDVEWVAFTSAARDEGCVMLSSQKGIGYKGSICLARDHTKAEKFAKAACELESARVTLRKMGVNSPPRTFTPAEAAEVVRKQRGNSDTHAPGQPAAKPREDSVPEGFAGKVLKLVRDRGTDYGHPSDNHQLTADMLSSWFSRQLGRKMVFTAEDVCVVNVLQKLSRLAQGSKDDSWFDIAGYTENVAMLRKEQRNPGQ